MGYRKRGPKPKHLLLQVFIILSADDSFTQKPFCFFYPPPAFRLSAFEL